MTTLAMPRGSPELWEAAGELKRRLEGLKIDALEGDRFYIERYLREKLEILESSLMRSVSQLTLVMSRTSPHDTILIDHGGGLGLTGLLAKLTGARVVYNDIDSSFLNLARRIGREVNAEADLYILGDWPVLVRRLEEERVVPNALVSYDVIEHIADMSAFIHGLGQTPWRPFQVVMSSGANMFSPRYLAHVVPIQLRSEREWRKMRLAILRELAPDLPERIVRQLARRSRRFQRNDLNEALKRWRVTGRWSDEHLSETNRFDPFWTNTVHPETGWWSEHLMHPWRLCALLSAEGFVTEVRLGLYGRPRARWKRCLALIMNWLVERLGAPAITIAAYYTLFASRNKGVD